MDHPADHDSGEQGHGEIHLPDPSIWPLVAGVAGMIFGAALIYFSRDRDSDWAGLFLGAAAVLLLITGFGWAYEDGRMKRKAEAGLATSPRNARYTQVVTFGVAEGAYLTARQAGGIISELEASDTGLRNLDGFQDMRVIVSPAETGPSQVLVETTWADREGLATYEQTRTTMLDLLSAHPDEVVPGSVQVFDMEVVRDTKDTSFNFGTGAMAGMFSALIVGGFMVGAGLNMFAGEGGGEGGGPPEAVVPGDTVVARNIRFTVNNNIIAPPNTVITLKFDNKDVSPPHNIEIFAGSSAEGDLLQGCTAGCDPSQNGGVYTPLVGGPIVQEFTFTTPGPGKYAFNCAAHPVQMTGTLTIEEGAPIPGAAAPPAAGISPAAGTSPAAGASPAAGTTPATRTSPAP